MSTASPPAIAFKDNKLLAFVTLIRKRTVILKVKKKTVKFQIPLSGFSLPDLKFSAFNEHVVWSTSSQISILSKKKSAVTSNCICINFDQNAKILRLLSAASLFALKWTQV